MLRAARRRRALTLGAVQRASRGRFKASAVDGYERGERAISLERFCELAALYGAPPDRLLAEVMEQAGAAGRARVVIDLNRLGRMPEENARQVAEFVHDIKARRGDYLSDVITLRSGDVEELALSAGVTPRRLLSRIEPSLGERAEQDEA